MAFTDTGWRDWLKFHRAVFCMDGAIVDALFKELEPMFRRNDVTAEELEEATCWMCEDVERAQLPWKAHYATLMGRIKRERIRKATAHASQEDLQAYFAAARKRRNGLRMLNGDKPAEKQDEASQKRSQAFVMAVRRAGNPTAEEVQAALKAASNIGRPGEVK